MKSTPDQETTIGTRAEPIRARLMNATLLCPTLLEPVTSQTAGGEDKGRFVIFFALKCKLRIR